LYISYSRKAGRTVSRIYAHISFPKNIKVVLNSEAGLNNIEMPVAQ
jgi:hypothetical protein